MLPPIPWALQNIFANQPELTKRIFHNHLTKRQLPEIGLFNPLLQLTAGVGFIRNVTPRLRNRQRFGSTNNICHTSVSQDCCGKQKHLLIGRCFCQSVKKASQSSLRQQRKRFKIVFDRGAPQGGFSCPFGAIHLLYVGENTSQAASAVRRAANLMEQLPVAIAP